MFVVPLDAISHPAYFSQKQNLNKGSASVTDSSLVTSALTFPLGTETAKSTNAYPSLIICKGNEEFGHLMSQSRLQLAQNIDPYNKHNNPFNSHRPNAHPTP